MKVQDWTIQAARGQKVSVHNPADWAGSQTDALTARWWELKAEWTTTAASPALWSHASRRRNWNLWWTKVQFQTERECDTKPQRALIWRGERPWLYLQGLCKWHYVSWSPWGIRRCSVLCMFVSCKSQTCCWISPTLSHAAEQSAGEMAFITKLRV